MSDLTVEPQEEAAAIVETGHDPIDWKRRGGGLQLQKQPDEAEEREEERDREEAAGSIASREGVGEGDTEKEEEEAEAEEEEEAEKREWQRDGANAASIEGSIASRVGVCDGDTEEEEEEESEEEEEAEVEEESEEEEKKEGTVGEGEALSHANSMVAAAVVDDSGAAERSHSDEKPAAGDRVIVEEADDPAIGCGALQQTGTRFYSREEAGDTQPTTPKAELPVMEAPLRTETDALVVMKETHPKANATAAMGRGSPEGKSVVTTSVQPEVETGSKALRAAQGGEGATLAVAQAANWVAGGVPVQGAREAGGRKPPPPSHPVPSRRSGPDITERMGPTPTQGTASEREKDPRSQETAKEPEKRVQEREDDGNKSRKEYSERSPTRKLFNTSRWMKSLRATMGVGKEKETQSAREEEKDLRSLKSKTDTGSPSRLRGLLSPAMEHDDAEDVQEVTRSPLELTSMTGGPLSRYHSALIRAKSRTPLSKGEYRWYRREPSNPGLDAAGKDGGNEGGNGPGEVVRIEKQVRDRYQPSVDDIGCFIGAYWASSKECENDRQSHGITWTTRPVELDPSIALCVRDLRREAKAVFMIFGAQERERGSSCSDVLDGSGRREAFRMAWEDQLVTIESDQKKDVNIQIPLTSDDVRVKLLPSKKDTLFSFSWREVEAESSSGERTRNSIDGQKSGKGDRMGDLSVPNKARTREVLAHAESAYSRDIIALLIRQVAAKVDDQKRGAEGASGSETSSTDALPRVHLSFSLSGGEASVCSCREIEADGCSEVMGKALVANAEKTFLEREAKLRKLLEERAKERDGMARQLAQMKEEGALHRSEMARLLESESQVQTKLGELLASNNALCLANSDLEDQVAVLQESLSLMNARSSEAESGEKAKAGEVRAAQEKESEARERERRERERAERAERDNERLVKEKIPELEKERAKAIEEQRKLKAEITALSVSGQEKEASARVSKEKLRMLEGREKEAQRAYAAREKRCETMEKERDTLAEQLASLRLKLERELQKEREGRKGESAGLKRDRDEARHEAGLLKKERAEWEQERKRADARAMELERLREKVAVLEKENSGITQEREELRVALGDARLLLRDNVERERGEVDRLREQLDESMASCNHYRKKAESLAVDIRKLLLRRELSESNSVSSLSDRERDRTERPSSIVSQAKEKDGRRGSGVGVVSSSPSSIVSLEDDVGSALRSSLKDFDGENSVGMDRITKSPLSGPMHPQSDGNGAGISSVSAGTSMLEQDREQARIVKEAKRRHQRSASVRSSSNLTTKLFGSIRNLTGTGSARAREKNIASPRAGLLSTKEKEVQHRSRSRKQVVELQKLANTLTVDVRERDAEIERLLEEREKLRGALIREKQRAKQRERTL